MHTPHIVPVGMLITPNLSTILSTLYPQGLWGYQQVQACPVCITGLKCGYAALGVDKCG